jgi:hypothetical protein
MVMDCVWRVIRLKSRDSDAPEASGAVNERNDENVFLSELIHKPIRLHEQLPDRLIIKLWYRLPALSEISEGDGSVTSFLNKGGRVKL